MATESNLKEYLEYGDFLVILSSTLFSHWQTQDSRRRKHASMSAATQDTWPPR